MPAVALVAALALGAAACSDDATEEPGADPSPSSSATRAVETTVRWGAIAGKVAPARREQVKEAVSAVVDRWLEAAYVGGEWPRSDFSDAFPGFTAGAAQQAQKDLDLMTNSAVGGQVESVEVLSRAITLDALGVKGRATGVTARFALRYRTTGEVEGTEWVRGRLFLTPREGGWRVFGYDVARSDRKGATR